MPRQGPANAPSSASLHAKAWAQIYELIDLQLSPLGLRTVDALSPRLGNSVLDIGCGAGQTLAQLAERVGTGGRVIGVDIAPRLLEIANRRFGSCRQVGLIETDAQVLDLPAESMDAVFSRFGVMGFADPVVAFANFRGILKPSGVLAFCCWRSLAENELDRLPLAAAGVQMEADQTPFSLADPNHIQRTLQSAGFSKITIDPYDEDVSCGDVDATLQVLLNVGPLGRIVRENPDLRANVAPRLREALATLGDPADVRLTASIWIVTARAEEAG